MKILNKQELQQVTINHSSDIDFRDFINLCKKYTAKPYSFLDNDTSLNHIILYVLDAIVQKEYKNLDMKNYNMR